MPALRGAMLPAGHCLVLLAGTGLFLLLLHLHTPIGLNQPPWPPIGASGSTGRRGPAQNKPDLGKSNLTIVLCKLLPGAAHEKWSRNKNFAKMDDDRSQLGILIMTREHCGDCMSSTFFGQRPLFCVTGHVNTNLSCFWLASNLGSVW